MPLLCISLLALLLLPLSLSCDSQRPPGEVRNDYMVIVQTDLDNTRGSISAFLHNSSCPDLKHKLRTCMPNITNIVSTLHNLSCRMKNLRHAPSEQLAVSVLNSIRCPCHERPTKEPNWKLRTATRRRRSEHRKSRETKNHCKAKAILSAVTECYEMLNTLSLDI